MVDEDSIRRRALHNGLLIDMDAISKRVSRGDTVFSMRVVLTALVKYGDDARQHIMDRVKIEHFRQSLFGDIAGWVITALSSTGTIDVVDLYRNMESYVQDTVLPEHLRLVDQVIATDKADVKAVLKAVRGPSQSRQPDSADAKVGTPYSQRTVLAALFGCDDQTRRQIIDVLDSEYFDDMNLSLIFNWVKELVETDVPVNRNHLHRKAQDYVMGRVLPGYTSVLDHILALEKPDAKMLDDAIAWLDKVTVCRSDDGEKLVAC